MRLVSLFVLALCTACTALPQTGAPPLPEGTPYPQLQNTAPLLKAAAALSPQPSPDATGLRARAEALAARPASDLSRTQALSARAEALRAR